MNFLIQLAWAVFFAYASRVFAPSRTGEDAKAATLAEVDAPNISEGSTVPVFVGTVKLDGQNVSWFGGLSANAITQQGVVTGYRYNLTVQLTFAFGPIDGIKEIRFEDNVVAYTATETIDYWDLAINAPGLFGGDQQEGGVAGTMRLYKGTTTQTRDIEVNTLIGAETPSFRRVCYAVARNFYWGTSPRLKPFAPVLQRWPNTLGLTGDAHRIGTDDANPIAFLYECMTDPIWGAGEPSSRFDLASWRAAAVQVKDEGLGISLRLSSADTLDSVVASLLKYVDGTVYEDPATGLYTLVLIRDVGEPALVLDKQVLSKAAVSRISWTELRNTVKVTYTDRSRNYETGAIQAQQSAALASVGNVADLESVDLPGFMSPEPAVFAATRLLRTVSYPLSKVSLGGTAAELSVLRPGMAFRLEWERPTLSAVYRATKVNYGTLESPVVTVEALEDVFSTDSNTFTVPPASGWSGAGVEARQVTEALLVEQPYHWTRAETRDLIYGVVAPNSGHVTYKVVTDGSYADTTPYPFAAVAVLNTALAQWTGASEVDLTLTVANLPSTLASPNAAQYDAGQALLQIDGELLAYRTLTRNPDGTVTFGQCARGSLDTVPAAHVAGARVWVITSIYTRPALALATDTTVAMGALTSTLSDAQVAGEEAVTTITTASRAHKPIAPGAFQINGQFYPAEAESEPVLTWTTRTRAATQVVLQDAADQGAEASTAYHVTVTGDTTHTHTTSSQTHTLPGTVYGNVRVQVAASRTGHDSFQAQFCDLYIHPPALALESGDRLLLETGVRLALE